MLQRLWRTAENARQSLVKRPLYLWLYFAIFNGAATILVAYLSGEPLGPASLIAKALSSGVLFATFMVIMVRWMRLGSPKDGSERPQVQPHR